MKASLAAAAFRIKCSFSSCCVRAKEKKIQEVAGREGCNLLKSWVLFFFFSSQRAAVQGQVWEAVPSRPALTHRGRRAHPSSGYIPKCLWVSPTRDTSQRLAAWLGQEVAQQTPATLPGPRQLFNAEDLGLLRQKHRLWTGSCDAIKRNTLPPTPRAPPGVARPGRAGRRRARLPPWAAGLRAGVPMEPEPLGSHCFTLNMGRFGGVLFYWDSRRWAASLGSACREARAERWGCTASLLQGTRCKMAALAGGAQGTSREVWRASPQGPHSAPLSYVPTFSLEAPLVNKKSRITPQIPVHSSRMRSAAFLFFLLIEREWLVKLVNVVQHVLMINYRFRISSVAMKTT